MAIGEEQGHDGAVVIRVVDEARVVCEGAELVRGRPKSRCGIEFAPVARRHLSPERAVGAESRARLRRKLVAAVDPQLEQGVVALIEQLGGRHDMAVGGVARGLGTDRDMVADAFITFRYRIGQAAAARRQKHCQHPCRRRKKDGGLRHGHASCVAAFRVLRSIAISTSTRLNNAINASADAIRM